MKEVKEIERRFLLKNSPKIKLTGVEDMLKITQYYIDSEGKRKRLRKTTHLKLSGHPSGSELKESYEFLYKIKKGHGEFVEMHEDFTPDLFETFITNAHKKMVKTRIVYLANGLKFEIDKFENVNLIIMEVELEDINQEIIFPPEIQEQIIMEVTGINELSNYNLAETINKKENVSNSI